VLALGLVVFFRAAIVWQALLTAGAAAGIALAWRILCQQSSDEKAVRGCKTTRFVLALWFVTGGFIVLSVCRRVDPASALLVSALCSAAAYGLAGPVEKLFLPWADRFQSREDATRANELDVESFWVPSFLWLKGGRAFRVRQIPEGKTPIGSEIRNECAV
jgi:hypothetical protein